MDLAAAFYMSVYGLAALAGGILAWAEQTPSVTALTPPITIAAILLNERFRLIRLDGIWIGIAGLAAFVYPTIEFFNGNEEVRLLAGAHLLAILQWVLLFYNKLAHQYWWICAVSCLQIALAALLTSSPVFGLLILIYMFLALWTLSLFTLLLARLRYGSESDQPTQNRDWVWPKLRADEVLPLQQTKTTGGKTASQFRNSFQGNPHEADINWRFVIGVCGLSAAALLLGLVFFLLTPRLWMGAGNPFQDTQLVPSTPATGYSEKVQLRDFGKILESAAPVLELQLINEQTNKPVPLYEYLATLGQTEPLLRGTVLASYQDGEWYPVLVSQPGVFNHSKIPFLEKKGPYIRQLIRLEATESRTIFSLTDPEYGRIEDNVGQIRIYRDTHTLTFTSNASFIRGAIRYYLAAPTRVESPNPPRYQVKTSSFETEQVQDPQRPRRRRPTVDYKFLPPKLTYLIELAQQLKARAANAAAPDEPTPTQIADTIVSFLRDSGQFQYSLDQSRIDPSVDPIIDFLKNRKTGHCQYFATSLALLLRAVNIETRVVTGFKGGIERPEDGFIEVQQRHAHAWVEARLNGKDWVTLDATPFEARAESVAAVGAGIRWYHSLFSNVASLWNDYVVNLSFTKQQRDLYAPVQEFATNLLKQLQEGSNLWTSLLAHAEFIWKHPEYWFSLQGGLTAFFLMTSATGIAYGVRYLYRRFIQLRYGVTTNSQGRIIVEFYERFLALVKPLGFVPAPHQTQLEFAQQVETAWSTNQFPIELRSLAKEISLAFYRLRYGAETLTDEQESRLKSRLKELELQLKK